MLRNGHVRFGGRPAETHPAQARQGAAGRPYTDLYSPFVGKVFKAYKIVDIFSRDIKGYCVHEREADHLAVDMFTQAVATHGAPITVHADNGAAMTSTKLRDYLTGLGVDMTHNRPYVSNDNPFSEAAFKTMKYRPGYPRIFETLSQARTYIDEYATWYNHVHKHSGIALFSPAEVADGTWEAKWEVRDRAMQDYYTAHPERFHARPTTPAPANLVAINHQVKKAA